MKPISLLARLNRTPSFWACTGLSLLLGFLFFYLSLTRYFPFDLGWDMDIVTVHDALLINSHHFPLHLDHPKFGMHLFTSLALEAGRWLNLISVSNFTELRQSPSPMLCLAELTLYLRTCEAILVWLTLVLSVVLLWILFPVQRLLRLAGIPLLGLQTGLLYCSMTMRTEAFSIFLLLLGLVVFSSLSERALRSDNPHLEILAWLLGGFGFGLALLTKLQAIMAAPFFLLVCVYVASRKQADRQAADPAQEIPANQNPLLLPKGWVRVLPWLLGCSLLIWLGLAWQAWQMPTLPGAQPNLIPLRAYFSRELSLVQLLPHLKLQIVWGVLLSSSCLSLGMAFLGPQKTRHKLWMLYPGFWVGLIWAFFTPALMYLLRGDGLNKAWTYLLQMAQSCIWTDTNTSTAANSGSFATTLSFALVTNKNYLLLALAAAVMATYLLLAADFDDKKGLKTCLISFLAGTLLLLIGSRAILRDTIWFEFLGSLSVLLLLHHCWRGLLQKPLFQGLLLLCMLIPSAYNSLNLDFSRDQVYLYFAPFQSARYSALANAFFATNEMDLPQIFMSAYGPGLFPPNNTDKDVLRKAVEQARLLEPLRQMVDLQFMNLKVPVSALGMAEPGFPVWSNGNQWAHFNQVAEHLRGSVLVDPQQLPSHSPTKHWLGMNDQSALKDRWIRASGGSWISIYPTTDIQMLICLSRSDYQRLFHLLPDEAPPLEVRQGEQREAYYPIQIVSDHSQSIVSSITGYAEFDRKWLNSFHSPPFFLIRNGNAWGPEYPRWSDMSALLENPSKKSQQP